MQAVRAFVFKVVQKRDNMLLAGVRCYRMRQFIENIKLLAILRVGTFQDF